MSIPLHIIFSWFEAGDFPTETQFKETFSSFYHKDDSIPIENIEGFEEIFQSFSLEIENIKKILLSNDLSLDELQEIADYIKENKRQIELLKEDIIRNSSDDKINLIGSYSNWGAITYQNQFNDLVYDKIKNIEDATSSEKNKYEERVRGDSRIKHDLDTLSFVIDAYDTVTMFTIPLKVRRIDTNTIEVLFDSIPPNIIQITIKKI
ncbi:hemerythrin superfamily protein [Chryseobacterium ginsenosidimutans]|uniref:hypothetical protein n=1 Tax=Chryseobacterium ginsenosidimutans TaxID=687846 RepID=UPI002167BCBE|nr:hypothetical protein [Chryseobacterium ginsenosidimutans]MCS3870479.1 hemerythrin superfamily protein [Chryseobacterium ginsenosidimutans]